MQTLLGLLAWAHYKPRKCVALLQHSALNMFLLSRTGCELQRIGLFEWPSSGSMFGWERQRCDKVLEWHRICGCDIPSSSGAEGGRTHTSGQEHANADLWLQQDRNLFASYPNLPPLSNHTDSGVSKCQKNIQTHFLLNCRVRDYQLPWKCHTLRRFKFITYWWRKNCQQHPTALQSTLLKCEKSDWHQLTYPA